MCVCTRRFTYCYVLGGLDDPSAVVGSGTGRSSLHALGPELDVAAVGRTQDKGGTRVAVAPGATKYRGIANRRSTCRLGLQDRGSVPFGAAARPGPMPLATPSRWKVRSYLVQSDALTATSVAMSRPRNDEVIHRMAVERLDHPSLVLPPWLESRRVGQDHRCQSLLDCTVIYEPAVPGSTSPERSLSVMQRASRTSSAGGSTPPGSPG